MASTRLLRRLALSFLFLVPSACDIGRLRPIDPTVVGASVARVSGTACRETVEGSAFVVADGLYLTNAHVVAGVGPDLGIRRLDGSELTARLVGFDPERDIALLSVSDGSAPPLVRGTARAGDQGTIVSVTTDGDLDLIRYEVIREVSAGGEDIYGEPTEARRLALEVLADIGPGVSGAPLVNDRGELVGMVFAEARDDESAWAVHAPAIDDFLAVTNPEVRADPGPCK